MAFKNAPLFFDTEIHVIKHVSEHSPMEVSLDPYLKNQTVKPLGICSINCAIVLHWDSIKSCKMTW